MTREWTIGKNRAWFDEENQALIMSMQEMMEPSMVQDHFNAITEAFKGIKKGRNIIIDFSQLESTLLSEMSRKALKDEFLNAQGIEGDKIAVVGASPAIAMLSKVVINLRGCASTQFFDDKESAHQWFKAPTAVTKEN